MRKNDKMQDQENFRNLCLKKCVPYNISNELIFTKTKQFYFVIEHPKAQMCESYEIGNFTAFILGPTRMK